VTPRCTCSACLPTDPHLPEGSPQLILARLPSLSTQRPSDFLVQIWIEHPSILDKNPPFDDHLHSTMTLLATLTLQLVLAIIASAQHIHPHHHKHLPRLLTCRHSLLTTASTPFPTPVHHEYNPSKPPARSKNRSSSSASFTPNNNKAGIAGGDAYPIFKDHLGWWYDWSVYLSHPPNRITNHL
jgi:hypothetical protein